MDNKTIRLCPVCKTGELKLEDTHFISGETCQSCGWSYDDYIANSHQESNLISSIVTKFNYK